MIGWWQNRISKLPETLGNSIFRILKARHKKVRNITYNGFDVAIETPKGEYRHWHDPHTGEAGKTLIRYDYGFFEDSLGYDGDQVDVFLGPNEEADYAYVVKQLKHGTQKMDETKVMMGFDNIRDAKEAYLQHYDKPGFFGGITPYHIDVLRLALKESKNNPTVIKSILRNE